MKKENLFLSEKHSSLKEKKDKLQIISGEGTSELQWRITLDAMSEAVFLVDLEHTILQCNKATLDLLQKLKYDEIIGKKCHELVHGPSSPIEWCPMMFMLKTKKREVAVAQLGDKWVEISTNPVLDDDGNILGAVHIINDITKRKTAEQEYKNALKKSEQHGKEIKAVLDSTRSVLKYQNFDAAAKNIFNSCKDVIGAKSGYVALLSEDGMENEVLFLDSGGLSCLVNPELPMPIRGLRAQAYNTSKPVYDNDFMNSQWVKFMPKGHVILNNVLFAPLILEENTIGLIGLANKKGGFNDNDARIAKGLSELVAIALNNSKMLDSLETSESKFRKAYEQAEFYKDLFVHDMSNVLTTLQMSTDFYFQHSESPEKGRESNKLKEIIKMQLNNGKRLISNVRTMSKLEEGAKNTLEDIEVREYIEKARTVTLNSFPERTITIVIQNPDKTVKVRANDLLLDVFENLLNNAVKYNDNPAIGIFVQVSEEQEEGTDRVKIEFIDNGIGVSDAQKPYIFQRGNDERKGGKGMGIGLSLVKKIIESYNGHIWVEDKLKGEYTKGSKFIVLIPKAT